MPALAREGLDEQLAGFGKDRAFRLDLEPFAHIVGKARPFTAVVQKAANAIGGGPDLETGCCESTTARRRASCFLKWFTSEGGTATRWL